MEFSGDVGAVPAPGAGHPAQTCMGGVGVTETEEESRRPVAVGTTSDQSGHRAKRSMTPEEGKEEEKLLLPAAAAKEEEEEGDGQESTRERLKRHRKEMAGRVWVPEDWGQEKLLKSWVDCAAFDRPLVPAGLLTARRALVAEFCTHRPVRTPPTASSSPPLRVQNGCS